MMRLMFRILLCLALLLGGSAQAQTVGPYAHNNNVTPPNSGYINNPSLTANTTYIVKWPANAANVNINCPSPYWTSLYLGITVPAGDISNGTGAALQPAQRQRSTGETQFYMISATSQICSLEFWGS